MSGFIFETVFPILLNVLLILVLVSNYTTVKAYKEVMKSNDKRIESNNEHIKAMKDFKKFFGEDN